MAWTEYDSGSFTSTVDSTLRELDASLGGAESGPFDDDRVVYLELDVNDMAMGDQIEVWLKSETTTTARRELIIELVNVQTDGKVRTPPFHVHDGWIFEFVHPVGSAADFVWAVWAQS